MGKRGVGSGDRGIGRGSVRRREGGGVRRRNGGIGIDIGIRGGRAIRRMPKAMDDDFERAK